MITTLISSYAVSFGTELTAVGLISGIFSITALFFRPVGGFLSDFLNKKRICVYTTFLIALVIVFYALSPTVSILLVMRVLHGALFGINGTANMALATEFIPDDHMGEGLGYYGLGQVLAQIVGPTIGIAIRDAFGYRALFFIIAASTLLAAVVLQTAFHYETVVGHSSEGRHSLSFSSLIAKECIFYSLIAGLFSMGNGIVNSFLVLLGESSKIAQISLFFSVNAIVLFVLRLLVGKVIDRANLLFIVNLSLLAGAGSMILIGKSGILVPILIAAAIKPSAMSAGKSPFSLPVSNGWMPQELVSLQAPIILVRISDRDLDRSGAERSQSNSDMRASSSAWQDFFSWELSALLLIRFISTERLLLKQSFNNIFSFHKEVLLCHL